MSNNNNQYPPAVGLSQLGQHFQAGTVNNNQNAFYNNTGIGNTAIGFAQSVALTNPAPLPYSLPMARNALADHCALAVYERRVSLKETAKEMPGDFDVNRKLLGDIFLMSPCHMTLEQAASLAFALHEEVGGFLGICDQVGAIIPSGA